MKLPEIFWRTFYDPIWKFQYSVKRTFNDWCFWMTQDRYDPDELRNRLYGEKTDGKIYFNFWRTVNSGWREIMEQYYRD
jgi:hypothetical protein